MGKGKGEGQGEGEGKGSPPISCWSAPYISPISPHISPLHLPSPLHTFLLVRSMHSGMHTREMRPNSACKVELGLG